jgi:nucleoid DNA-binding protein
MKKTDLAKRLARRSGLTVAQAADELDRTVNRIARQLRRGEAPRLPGLGKFTREKNAGAPNR